MENLSWEELTFVESVKKTAVRKGGSFVLSSEGNIDHGIPYDTTRWIHGEESAIGAMVSA